VLNELDSVKVSKVVAMLDTGSRKIASHIVFIERFDDFSFKGSNLLVLSTIDSNGQNVVQGIIMYGDANDLDRCLITARNELCLKDSLDCPIFFCEPDPIITVSCFKAFI